MFWNVASARDEISLRKWSGGTAHLRTFRGSIGCSVAENALCWQQSWASEGFFPGGVPVGDFPKNFSGGPKMMKFRFYPSKLKKQLVFANNFKIQRGQGPTCPPIRRPW